MIGFPLRVLGFGSRQGLRFIRFRIHGVGVSGFFVVCVWVWRGGGSCRPDASRIFDFGFGPRV